jgi:hypothetical protein
MLRLMFALALVSLPACRKTIVEPCPRYVAVTEPGNPMYHEAKTVIRCEPEETR